MAVDLGIFNKKEHTFSFKEAVSWSVVWISISVAFGIFIYYDYGHDLGAQWFTAYMLEKTLSFDNLFVISLIFGFFATPSNLQHRCLFWGIIGAIILRGAFIISGVELLKSIHWLLYVFGAFLVYSGIKILVVNEEEENQVQENAVVKWFRKHFPVTPDYMHTKFFTKLKTNPAGKLKIFATPLFIVLLMIETTDIIFAVDSIPAGLGVSKNAFILYTSNIMAVLGLRALYFVLLSIIEKFWLLKYGIGIVLSFIGVKMLGEHWVHISSNMSMIVTLSILSLSMISSILFIKK